MIAPVALITRFRLRLAPHIFTWLLLVTIAILTAAQLDQAQWVPDSGPLVNAVLWGCVFGIALAHARWRGWIAALFHLFIAFLLLGGWIGRIVPALGLFSSQPAAAFDLLNIRLLSYLDRLAGWLAALAAGGSVGDSGLFLLLIGALAWAAGAWLAWAVLRRRRPVSGLLPAGLLLGVNTYLSGLPVDAFWVFCGCALPLLAQTAFVELHAGWDRRQVDYPDELGFSWTGAAAVLGLVIFFAARLSPLFGTPEGWKTLSDLFKEAQVRLEETTTRLFGDVAPPRLAAQENQPTFEPPAPRAETPQMGLVGLAPSQSTALVMWVTTSDPPPPEPEPDRPGAAPPPAPIHYWRSGLYGKYTGSGWEGLELLPASPAAPAGQAPAGRYLLHQQFEIRARHSQELFAASAPAAAQGAGLRRAGPDASPLVYGQAANYTVDSWVTQAGDVLLRAAPSAYPPEIAALYLQLPSSLPQRVRDLARRVVGDAATPYDKAVRLQDFLRLSYPYDTRVPPPPGGRDVVDYFLFDAPGGFCSYYSSAMAVMLRSQGVAARVATGFATGAYDYTRGAYRVTPSNAHAWVEVYFPGYGWVEFEPTSALLRIGYETAAGAPAAPGQPLPARPIPPPPAWQGLLLAAAALIAPILLLVLAFVLRRRRQRLDQGVREPAAYQAERHYLRLRALLACAGLRPLPGATPAEYLSASAPALAAHAPLPAALRRATELYQQAVYSPTSPSYEDVDTARRQAARAWPAWLRLLLQHGWKRLNSWLFAGYAGE